MNIVWTDEELAAKNAEIVGHIAPEHRGKVLEHLKAYRKALSDAEENFRSGLHCTLAAEDADYLFEEIQKWTNPATGAIFVIGAICK